MASTTLLSLLTFLPFALAGRESLSIHKYSLRSSSRNVPPAGYYDPSAGNGSLLTSVPDTSPPGLHEPINVILTGNSDQDVLVDAQTNGGLRNYYISFGFAGECLGQHSGSDQAADLGDGNGYLNETAVMRWDYGDPTLGTCTETVEGGNHFRYWVQNGPAADSGAVFMALSYELPIAQQHDIVLNGYNFARDYLVGNITNQTIPTANLTNTSTYSGSTSSGGYTYQTNIQYVSGLLSNTSNGINHFATVGTTTTNAIDGLVAVMTVKITQRPSNSSAWRLSPPQTWRLPLLALSSFILPLVSI